MTDDEQEALALYRTMRSDELRELRAAHASDQRQATRPESVAFGIGRLALIATVLRERGEDG
jgi:hypothetical protein